MASFYIWETVDFTITLSDPDALNDAKDIMVSIRQGGIQIDKLNPVFDSERGIIELHLTQEETGQFSAGNAVIQVNIYCYNTERDATAQGMIRVLDNLYREVMS